MNIKHNEYGNTIVIKLNEKVGRDVMESDYVKVHLDEEGKPTHIFLLEADSYTDDPSHVTFEDVEFEVPTISVERFAADRGMNPERVRQILREDQELPVSERKMPGAYREGSGQRATWRIPVTDANNYQPPKLGRPKASA